ncbi:MAG: glycosyltransferase, partial [Jatrophihabitantaceae bacterium]
MLLPACPEPAIDTVGVVIPAHNEAALLASCLSSVSRAAGLAAARGLGVEIVVVLDRCSDGTAEVVASFAGRDVPVSAVGSERAGVGWARAAGVDLLIARHGSRRTWLCTTDADSTVADGWILGQLDHAAAGADAVVGTVQVTDWSGHPPLAVRRYYAGYHQVDGHRHVHGANLAFRADSYLAAGGFGAAAWDEDVDLVRRIELTGARI